jgi:hypothetical protein
MGYNLATCAGWVTEQDGFGVADAGCIGARLMLVVLFFVVAICKKWLLGDDEIVSMNLVWGILFTFIPYILIISLTGAMKWSFLGSLVGGFAWVGLSMTGMLGQQ